VLRHKVTKNVTIPTRNNRLSVAHFMNPR
jgi:hypothetical protein